MVDLNRQLEPIKSEIDSAIKSVFAVLSFIQGKPVKEFDKNLAEWVGAKYSELF